MAMPPMTHPAHTRSASAPSSVAGPPADATAGRVRLVLWLAAAATLLAAGPFIALGPRLAWIVVAVLAGLAALGWVAGGLRRPPRLARAGALHATLALGLAVAAFSFAWTPHPGDAATAWLDLVLLACGYVILDRALASFDRRMVDRLAVIALVAVGALAATLAIELAANQPIFRWVKGLDGGVTLPDATLNRVAVAVVALAFGAARLTHGLLAARAPAVRRGGVVAVLALAAGLAFASPSQSAQAGLVAGLVAWTVAALLGRRATLLALAAVAITAAAAAIPLAGQLYGGMALHRADALPTSAQHRVEIWHFAAERAAERPILGNGFDASRHLANDGAVSAFQEPGQSVIPLHPHSLFLQVWLELGLVGAAILIAALVAVAVRLWAAGRLTDNADIALAAALLTMLNVAYGAWQAWWLSVLILAVVLATLGGRRAAATPAPDGRSADPLLRRHR